MNPRRIRRLVRFLILAALVVLVALTFRNYSVKTIPARDNSLDPTYPGGSRVVVRWIDEDDDLSRGADVVYAMERDGVVYARYGRLYGLPGDLVESVDGRIHVNGEATPVRGEAAGTVPPGTAYILATNPFESRYVDSRQLGFISRDAVRGIILARFSFGW